MKKLFFLTALLCASVMAFATAEDTWLEGNPTYANQFKWFSIDGVTAPMEVVNIQSKDGFDVIFVNVGQADFDREVGIIGCEAITDMGAGVWIKINSLTKKQNTILFKNSAGATLRGLIIYNEKGEAGEEPEKADPQLTLNQDAVTLSADVAETFQIVPSREGEGAISYESNKPGIASVSETGLVTAVGRGTASITVRVAATDSHAAALKKLTVTVTGKLNWDALEWLGDGAGGGAYSNKYKLAPADGQNVVNIQNREVESVVYPGIYTTFEGVVEACSLGAGNFDIQGGGIWLFLAAFTKQYTEVTVTAGGKDYTFEVFFVDGQDTATAITNVSVEPKAVKIIENGVLYIVKDGIRYNVLGTKQN